MIPSEWSSSLAKSQEGSNYIFPFGNDDALPPLPLGLIDCYQPPQSTHFALHIGTSEAFPDPRPIHSASLQTSRNSSSGSELSFAEDAISGETDLSFNAQDSPDGSIFPFSDPETDYSSWHLHGYVSPFENEEPSTRPKKILPPITFCVH